MAVVEGLLKLRIGLLGPEPAYEVMASSLSSLPSSSEEISPSLSGSSSSRLSLRAAALNLGLFDKGAAEDQGDKTTARKRAGKHYKQFSLKKLTFCLIILFVAKVFVHQFAH